MKLFKKPEEIWDGFKNFSSKPQLERMEIMNRWYTTPMRLGYLRDFIFDIALKLALVFYGFKFSSKAAYSIISRGMINARATASLPVKVRLAPSTFIVFAFICIVPLLLSRNLIKNFFKSSDIRSPSPSGSSSGNRPDPQNENKSKRGGRASK